MVVPDLDTNLFLFLIILIFVKNNVIRLLCSLAQITGLSIFLAKL